jgi:hypothetical protein
LQPQPQKKFRSAAAPKGAKLPSGYVDRARAREEGIEDDKAERVKALEEMMKLQQIDEETFVKLMDQILGGDVKSTHLVKGLDWKLLERVKRGEDVLNGDEKDEEVAKLEDIDDEFEKLEEREVQAVQKEEKKKRGEMAPPSLMPGKKRNRDQILAELKAARQAAKEAAGPSLGAKFKKVGEARSTSRIETDHKGREVLITVDENGNEKRKVRKVQIQEDAKKGHGLLMPDKDAKPLGMKVAEVQPAAEEEGDEEINIFDDAGDDYDPLAGLEDESEDSDGEEGKIPTNSKEKASESVAEKKTEPGSMAPPPRPKSSAAPRNYFGDSNPVETVNNTRKALDDPTILAALKKASTLEPIGQGAMDPEEAAKEARRKKMLQQDDRDADDMDMGFGSSRFEDEEDFGEQKLKLSEWGGKGGDNDDDGGKGDGKGKRKRGPKKRKGDGNNAADVMKVLERRNAAGS